MKNKTTVLLKKHKYQVLLLILAINSLSIAVNAGNLQISNVSIAVHNTSSHFSLVKFDIGWDNSWRVSTGPTNWDAAWVFLKFRIKTSKTWKHATLNWIDGTGSGDGHIVPVNATIASSNDNGSGGSHGVFIYHATNMTQAAVNYPSVQLRWNYGIDGVTDHDSVEICVLGIETVRVPQGDFWLGDASTNIEGQFYDAFVYNNFSVTAPYHITSENSITLGGAAPGSIGNYNSANMLAADDFNDVTSKTLPAPFPKGYKAFYCMKYEVTQEQYVTFLNKLSYNQQATNTGDGTPPNSPAGTNVLTSFGQTFRNGITIKIPGVDATAPAEYACDQNANGIYNEANDGHDIACNNISWSELMAFLDWSALRPMTELEFEKACRGNQTPVADETAWGSPFDFNLTSGFNNGGAYDETPAGWGPNPNVNATDWPGYIGPARAGSFGTGINTRYATGATYYGIMEMTGNLFERTVSIGNTAGRSFNGVHGDGVLNPSYISPVLKAGHANTPNWPDASADGSGFRGGAFGENNLLTVAVSDRFYASSAQPFPLYNFGGRGVRTAPY